MQSKIKLVIFDLDDTLTSGPTIWETVHKEAGTWESHGLRYWKDFCRGKFGYNRFIRMDVACWKGLSTERVMKAIRRTKFSPGIRQTFKKLKSMGIKIAVISSSLEIFANYVAKKFGIDHVHANVLEVKNGELTGKIHLAVPGFSKGRLTRRLRQRLRLRKSEVMAVGDSAFDIPMFKEAGIAVSFTDADKKTKAAAKYHITRDGLSRLLKVFYQ